jgi:hypothetical protein
VSRNPSLTVLSRRARSRDLISTLVFFLPLSTHGAAQRSVCSVTLIKVIMMITTTLPIVYRDRQWSLTNHCVQLKYCSEVLCAFKDVSARCSMLCIVCVVVVPERPSDFPLLLLCPVSERLSAHPWDALLQYLNYNTLFSLQKALLDSLLS